MIIRSITFDPDALVRCKGEGLHARFYPGTVQQGGSLKDWLLTFYLDSDEEGENAWANFDVPVSLSDLLFGAEMIKVFYAFLGSKFAEDPVNSLDMAFQKMFDQVYSEARIEIKGWEHEGKEKKIRALVFFQRAGNAPRTLSFLVGVNRREEIFELL